MESYFNYTIIRMIRFFLGFMFVSMLGSGCRFFETYEYSDTRDKQTENGQSSVGNSGLVSGQEGYPTGEDKSDDNKNDLGEGQDFPSLDENEKNYLKDFTYNNLQEHEFDFYFEPNKDEIAASIQKIDHFFVSTQDVRPSSAFQACLDGLLKQLKYVRQHQSNVFILSARLTFDSCVEYLHKEYALTQTSFKDSIYIQGEGILFIYSRITFEELEIIENMSSITVKELYERFNNLWLGTKQSNMLLSYGFESNISSQSVITIFEKKIFIGQKNGDPCETKKASTLDPSLSSYDDDSSEYLEMNCSVVEALSIGINDNPSPMLISTIDQYEIVIDSQSINEKGYLFPMKGESQFSINNVAGSVTFREEKLPVLRFKTEDDIQEFEGVFSYDAEYFIIDRTFTREELNTILGKIKLNKSPGLYKHMFVLKFDLSELSMSEKDNLKIFSKLPEDSVFILEDPDNPNIFINKSVPILLKIAKGLSESDVIEVVYTLEPYSKHTMYFEDNSPSPLVTGLEYDATICNIGSENQNLISVYASTFPYEGVFKFEMSFIKQPDLDHYENISARVETGPDMNYLESKYHGNCNISVDLWSIEKKAYLSCRQFKPDINNLVDLFDGEFDKLDFSFSCDIQYDWD